MERKNGGHIETFRVCPNCEWLYIIQHGGQKSGGSPCVHVEKVGGRATGYCSERCMVTATGGSLEDTKKWHSSLGIDYDKVFPPGYLAPSRIPKVLVQVASIRNLKERVAKNSGRR